MLLTRSPRAALRRPVPPGAARCRPHRPAALTATMVTSHLRGDVVGFWQQRENVRNEHAPLPPKRPKSSSRTEPELYRSVRPEPIIMMVRYHQPKRPDSKAAQNPVLISLQKFESLPISPDPEQPPSLEEI